MKYIICILAVFVVFRVDASIYCPGSVILSCYDDINNLSKTGSATTVGYPQQLLRYRDQKNTNQCNIGTIYRLWYIDLNNDYTNQSNEPSCSQIIQISSGSNNIQIFFPKDITYNCKDEILKEIPTWYGGPCDAIGYNIKDAVLEVSGTSCYKILRTFTVINWCTYTGNSYGPGYWSHTQKIKVEENNPPEILDCTDKIIPLDGDCTVYFSLENSAIDDELCQSKILSWIAEIDLWGDGVIDYKYGFNESGIYKMLPVGNGEKISFTLPIKVGAGKHKVKWTVRDECGNFSGCTVSVETKDTKPPTPYIHDFITSAFDGKFGGLDVHAKIFDAGSFDNCTPKSLLKFSFSPDVNDTIRKIDCTNAGFQFMTLHITDLDDNVETMDVFMLVFDNGTCFSQRSLNGEVSESNGNPISSVQMMLKRPQDNDQVTTSKGDGTFLWDKIAVHGDYTVSGSLHKYITGKIDIADLKMLQDHFFGVRILHDFEWLAADINNDGKIKVGDLELLRSKILHPALDTSQTWTVVPGLDSIRNNADFQKLKKEVILREVTKKLSFKAVYLGDISEANIAHTGSRSKHILQATQKENEIEFYSTSDIISEGVQIEIILNNPKASPTIRSNFFNLEANNMSFDKNTGVFRFIAMGNIEIDTKTPLFILHSDDVTSITKFTLTSESKLLLPKYKTVPLELNIKNIDSTIEIFPNPSKGPFTIVGNNIKIDHVLDITGKQIPFESNDNQLLIENKSGIFVVVLWDGQNYFPYRIIKY